MPGGDDDTYDEIDESLIESLIIISLAAALAWLVYYRQLRQQRAQAQNDAPPYPPNDLQNLPVQQGARLEDQPPRPPAPGPQPVPPEGQQADGGFFPPPQDPNFGQWAAGGVGH